MSWPPTPVDGQETTQGDTVYVWRDVPGAWRKKDRFVQTASEVAVTPSGGLASTNVQAALAEHQGDIEGLIGATAGKNVVAGSGAPTGGVGLDADFYYDVDTGDIYGPKSAGLWGTPVANDRELAGIADTTAGHLEALNSAELRGFGYRKVADITVEPGGNPGEIVENADGKLYYYDDVGVAWRPWFVDGTVLRQDISGAATVNVSGRTAAELTLTGDVTGLTFTGWAVDTTKYQQVRVETRQDATGGHAFDWPQVSGTWLETPPDDLDTEPNGSTLHFYAITTDGGATVWLEPVGITYYTAGCAYMQVVTQEAPAVSAGGSVTVAHSFDTVFGVEAVNLVTGYRLIADWKHVTPGDPSSPVEVDFDAAIGPGEIDLRLSGLASQPCLLSVSVSEWVAIRLSLNSATTITPRVSFNGAAGDVEWLWGDGTAPEIVVSGTEATHTYGTAYTGNATLRYRRGTEITRFESPNDPWSFSLSEFQATPDMQTLIINNTEIHGDLSALSGAASLTNLTARNNPGIFGDVGTIAGNTSLVIVDLRSTSVSGDVAQLTTLTAANQIWLGGTNVVGDPTTLVAIPGLLFLHLDSVPGVVGDVANFAAATQLQRLYFQSATNMFGSITPLASLVNLRIFEMGFTAVSGDLSAVTGAAAATLSTVRYSNVGANPTPGELDAAIADLAAAAVNNGLLLIGGNNPAPTNTAGITTLQGRGWTVTAN